MRSLLLVFLACALALAQIPTAPDPDEIPVYLPGGEEAGPSLPSNRGIGPIFSQNRLLRITPYLGVQGVYDTGLLPLSTNENGDLVRKPAIGIMATFGAAGSRPFRRSLLNLAYNGNVTHYPSIPFLSFSNHRMELAYSHSINRRITYLSNGGAIVMNTPFGGFGIPGGMPSLDANPTSEVFNTPIFSLTTQQSVNYQRTARLGITLGGGAFNTFRRSEALVSVQGVNATGTVSYRLSGRTTVAGVYSFGQFFFSNSYGGTNFHQANVELAHKLSKRTEIALGLGGVRIESQSLRSVPLDPIIASLLGRSTGIEAFYRKNYLPNFTATFRHSLRSVSFNAQASRMVNPGNGLVLTNQMTNASAGLSYSGLRRATLSVNGVYSQMQGLMGPVGQFTTYNVNVGTTYALGGGLSWTAGASVRRFEFGGETPVPIFFQRPQYQFVTGLRWSPSAIPVPFF